MGRTEFLAPPPEAVGVALAAGAAAGAVFWFADDPAAGRVAVPPRLKFWSSVGPTVSRGAVVVGRGGAI